MMALGLDAWWEDSTYRQCYTVNMRGDFILLKLQERDPDQLRTVLGRLYRDLEPLPEDITAAAWHTILTAMGATPEEIVAVQERMGCRPPDHLPPATRPT